MVPRSLRWLFIFLSPFEDEEKSKRAGLTPGPAAPPHPTAPGPTAGEPTARRPARSAASNERPLSLRPPPPHAPTAREQTAPSPTARLTAPEHRPPSITLDTKREHGTRDRLASPPRRIAPCPLASRPSKPSDWVGPEGPPSSHRVPDEKRFFVQETRRSAMTPRGEFP